MESQQSEKIAELLRVRRFKKALQKLRAEAKMRFVSEQERLEQKELDEGAIISFAADRAGSVSDRHKGTK
jgi:flagellar biosynthesis chaperone FliJ